MLLFQLNLFYIQGLYIMRIFFKKNKKKRILICGRLDYGPIGRHTISFIEILSKKYNVYVGCDCWKEFNDEILKIKYKSLINKFFDEKTEFDLFIFTDVMYHFDNNFIFDIVNKFNSKKKIAYPVFDGDIPPQLWIEILNNKFDIGIFPSHSLTNLFSKHLNIPCYSLPVIVHNSYLLKKIPKIKTKFRFGVIAAMSKRKNLLKVIKAFIEIFSNNTNVELLIHSPDVNESEYKNSVMNLLKSQNSSNIILSNKRITNEELQKLITTFDCYIYPSMGEGYSTTPREALSYGVPVILSSIEAHKEITVNKDIEGILFVNSNIKIKYYCPSLNNTFIGYIYDCEITEIKDKMKYVYNNFEKFMTKESITRRKKIGMNFSKREVQKLSENIFNLLLK
ncbi:MAG: Glycosyltransferase Gtf1 [Candidatus Anoxychlamydiales bacterium]|nr:Glycosyltransferase Gtf1 [Candidatus Anoxychlamydiales bacterium]